MRYDFNKKINRVNTNSIKWENEGILPFWIADMDFETCPEIVQAMEDKLKENIFGYVAKNDSYYESACDWTKKRYNYEINKDTLIHSPGAVCSLTLIIRLFSSENDKIMISTPVYPPFHECVVQNNRELVTNKMVIKDGVYKIDLEDFEKKASDPDLKWYVLCNPQNPTGRVWTKEELQQIGDICLKHNVRVVSDEVWRDLVFKNHTYTPFASLSKEIEDITITCFAASKTFNLAGLQASFVQVPRIEEFNKFTDEMQVLHIGRNNSFGAVAVEAAFNKGEEWLSELVDYLEGNLNYLEEFIKNNLPKIKFSRPQGTYVVWLDLREYNIDNIGTYLEENAKVKLNDGLSFCTESKGFLRMNIGCPRYILEEGLNRIKETLQDK